VNSTATGALVISLDFELRWGVRDHCPPGSDYERNVMGARAVIPQLLEIFREYGVAATWATVGFLFARSRSELHRYRPETLPSYADPALSPYAEVVGDGEADDPLHYAAHLIERIGATPRQEIATHTYSHFFCTERGQDPASFRADLASACAIAAARGVALRSIVFPRNQHNPAYDGILRDHGIVAFRGNPGGWLWRFADGRESAAPAKRAARLLDAYLPVSGDGSIGWDEIRAADGLANVRASFFLRPFVPRLRLLEPLRSQRLRQTVRSAARRRRILHLWWHPHNFGAHPQQCLAVLRDVLDEYLRCRDRWGMQSLSMAEIADAVIGARSTDAPTGDVRMDQARVAAAHADEVRTNDLSAGDRPAAAAEVRP
jgi:peptidoglycan/xylan/chitin deacetylase (PgdA/CDA1 family)